MSTQEEAADAAPAKRAEQRIDLVVKTQESELSAFPKLTPPASPKDFDTASISSHASSVPQLRPIDTSGSLLEAVQGAGSPVSPSDGSTEQTPRISTPQPYLPLRKRSSQRLRQKAGPPYHSPLNESGLPRAEQASPSLPFTGSRPRNGSAPRLRTEELRSGSAAPSPTSPHASRHEPYEAPRSMSTGRARGLTTESNIPPRPAIPLRSATSIPDYGPLRMNVRTGGPATYKPDRGPSSLRDSYRSSLRREPLVGSEDEVRQSFRSALTTGTTSTGFLDASGTERSSVLTKSSSVSDLFSIKAKDNETEEEGFSVEDAIEMYADGFFSDDPVEGRAEDVYDEGYASQATHPSSQRDSHPISETRRHSASLVETRLSILPSPKEKLLPRSPPASSHARTFTEIIAKKDSPLPAPPTDIQPSKPVPRDRYGFKKATQYTTVGEYDAWNRGYAEYLERRRRKWVALMRSSGLPYDKPARFPQRSDKVKRYIRKGIPPDWRGAAWFWYAGGPEKLAESPGLYWDLIEQADQGKLSESDKDIIERDLNRTFPDNVRFKPDPGPSMELPDGAQGGGELSPSATETPVLRALRRVLQAFAVHNPNIGYCQSLNFLAGLLLLFLDEDEEKAFIMLNIITSVHLPGTHSKVLEANVDVGVLMSCIRESIPAIWAKIDDSAELIGSSHLATSAVRLPTVSLATTSWFMSLFVGNLPIETVVRVWDSFFYEGSKTLFRISLAIFKMGEQEIRSTSDHMEIFQVVQGIPRRLLDANVLMEACYRRRNGFGHLSQDTIDARRAERRRLHAAERARVNGNGLEVLVNDQPSNAPFGSLRREASKRFKRSHSRRRARNA